MKATQVLPAVLMAIDLGAAMVCMYYSDWRRAVYWLAAATLTATVTF